MRDDLYEALGVSREASDAEIKRAYRKLARELHPDRNKNNRAAEERFKKVSAAYAVLANKEKRELYDKYGIDGLRDGFDPKQWERYAGSQRGTGVYENAGDFDFGGFSGFGGMEGIFESLFGQRGKRGRRSQWTTGVGMPGATVKTTLEVELMDAVVGRELQLAVPVEREIKNLKVKIPRGIEDGQSIRLKGQGQSGANGGPQGDMIIEVRIKEDPIYERKGMDLVKREKITLGKAYLGGTLEVETPWGKGKMVLPPGTQGGQKMRIKGHGVRKGQKAGDLLVMLEISIPRMRDEETIDLVKRLEQKY